MIPVLFNTLLFLIPLVFYKNTSELFEFNKIIIVYIFTILIASFWAYNSITHKKFIFRRTILDIPLLFYLITLLLSTLFSINPRTSWLGYYSRFNGGLVSQICYSILYWAFVSNINKENAKKAIYSIFIGTAITSLLATGEHFKIFATCAPIRHSILFNSENQNEISKYLSLKPTEKVRYLFSNSCWEQDVQNRVFSTMGQPNWLAALITALFPFSMLLFLENKSEKKYKKINFVLKAIYSLILNGLLFSTLIFTKSRSGLLAFGIESIIFWGFMFWKERYKYLRSFLSLTLLLTVLFFVTKIPTTSKTKELTVPQGNSLETGGTESGTIRKFVWIGAFNIFKGHPILGTGLETFAFAFPRFKPVEHNLTSEWDFIYNKAHNEYLNYLATTGIFGFAAYISIIAYSLIIIFKSRHFELLSGYVAILITNFFGFSVVPISLLFFLIPAISYAYLNNDEARYDKNLTKKLGRIVGILTFLISSSLIYLVIRYWQADIYYNLARISNKDGNTKNARVEIDKAIKLSPNEPIYIAEQSLTNKDVDLSAKALDLNPYNQNVRNILISNLNSKSKENASYLLVAEQIAEIGTQVAPMNPKIFYQLGILNLKNNKIEIALINLEKAVNLKPNYKEGRFALGLTYIDVKNYEKANENLEYILKNIDPNDELTKKYLEQAKSASK